MKRYLKRPHKFLHRNPSATDQNHRMGRLHGTTVGPWLNHGHPRAHCTGFCESMPTAPDHNSYLLYPVWQQKEQQLPQEAHYVQQDEMCFLLFPAPFVTCSQPTNIPASCLHLCPALAPQAAPWHCIPSQCYFIPKPHLSSCTPITTETRIPTYSLAYWCPKTVCISLLHPCNTHFSSWDILLPPHK